MLLFTSGQFYGTSLLGYSLIFVRNSPCLKHFAGKAICHKKSALNGASCQESKALQKIETFLYFIFDLCVS